MLEATEVTASDQSLVAAPKADIRPMHHDPFHGAATRLADLCRRVDEGEQMTGAFVATFGAAELAHAHEIDRRKSEVFYVQRVMKMARDKRADLDAYVQRLKVVEAELKKATGDAIADSPDLPWRDTLGKKLYLGSSKKLELGFDLAESKTITNVVDRGVVDLLGIEPKYLKPVGYFRLDTAAVKADLKAGVALDWATVETTRHVRGWEKEDASTSDDD